MQRNLMFLLPFINYFCLLTRLILRSHIGWQYFIIYASSQAFKMVQIRREVNIYLNWWFPLKISAKRGLLKIYGILSSWIQMSPIAKTKGGCFLILFLKSNKIEICCSSHCTAWIVKVSSWATGEVSAPCRRYINWFFFY